ncbi:MAG: hypothetical protein K8L99_15120 [Anaerolineae bacterium]|nr:hypothetical protein [Anaerolineae bacterium]
MLATNKSTNPRATRVVCRARKGGSGLELFDFFEQKVIAVISTPDPADAWAVRSILDIWMKSVYELELAQITNGNLKQELERMKPARQMIPLAKAAEYAGVSSSTMRAWVRRGAVHGMKTTNGRWLVDQNTVHPRKPRSK